jgi:hypothetical protein
MRIQYRICTLKSCHRNCETKYSLSTCLKETKYQLAVVNEHEHVEIQSQSEQLIRGLTPLCKEAIESILNEKKILKYRIVYTSSC